MGNTILHIDTSDANDLVQGLREMLQPRAFQQAMFRVMERAESRTRKKVREAVQHDYHAQSGWVNTALKPAKIFTDNSGVTCIIPVDGARGKIGADGKFKASAMSGGKRVRSAYEGKRRKRKRREIQVAGKVVKDGESMLPSGGDRPHIMLLGRAGHAGSVYVIRKDLGTYMATVHRRTKKHGVRTYKAKKSRILPAVGIGVPQMPMTRSAAAIQQEIATVVRQRVEHEFVVDLKKYCGKHMR